MIPIAPAPGVTVSCCGALGRYATDGVPVAAETEDAPIVFEAVKARP